MKSSLIFITVVAISIITVALTACNKKMEDRKTSEISTNIKELPLNLPYQPKAVWWQETRLGNTPLIVSFGPTDTRLDAVLLFDTKDLEAILKKLKRNIEPVYSPEQK